MEAAWVVASANKGKLVEISHALRDVQVPLLPVRNLVPDFDPEETGATFLENAALKAMAAFQATGRASIADDSGLCVEGLGGEPGVRSARYAGEGCTDAQRITFLLQKMDGMTGQARRAYFQCCCVAIVPTSHVAPAHRAAGLAPLPDAWCWVVANGYIHGTIGLEPVGTNGFGYDPLFYPDLYPTLTLAQLSLEQKTAVSHRGLAFAKFASMIERG